MALLSSRPAATGCYTHQCDPTHTTYSRGEMIDDSTYETNPILQPDSGVGSDEPWLTYGPNETLRIDYPDAVLAAIGGRMAFNLISYVGVSSQPDIPDANFANAEGQLGQWTAVDATGFTVYNNTCANYFARFVVQFPALGAPLPSGTADASE
jgi:hypothetical protein